MRSSIAFLAFLGLLAAHSLTAMADDAGEPVNPFTQTESSDSGVSASVSDEPAAEEKPGFSLPKLSLPKLPKPALPKLAMPKLQMPKVSMPQWTKKEPARESGPSTWQKLNNGTKSAFAKTRDTLMPWAAKDETPSARSITGSRASTGITRTRAGSNRNSGESTSEKKSFFSSWLPASEPEEKPIRTTSDFLSQKRPQFDE
jgi:hypothetical protein